MLCLEWSVYSPAGGNIYLLTASLDVSKQSFNPGPQHLQQKYIIIFSIHRFKYCYTSMDGHMKIHPYALHMSLVSPLCAVVMTWIAVTLPVGVFKDQSPLSIIHSAGARGHAVRTIPKVGACHTFVCTLPKDERKAEKHGRNWDGVREIMYNSMWMHCNLQWIKTYV